MIYKAVFKGEYTMFTILCNNCGMQSKYDPDKFGNAIDIMFEQGSLNVMDRMIIFCRECGNKQECGIQWPIAEKLRRNLYTMEL